MKSQPEGRLRRTEVSVWVHPRDNYQKTNECSNAWLL